MKKRMLAVLLSITMVLSSKTVYAESDIVDEINEEANTETMIENDERDADIIPEVSTSTQDITLEKSVNNTYESQGFVDSDFSIEYGNLNETIEEDSVYEITEGETLLIKNYGSTNDVPVIFNVPATKKYFILLGPEWDYSPYDDSISVFDKNNEEVIPSEKDCWLLTEGETVKIQINYDDKYPNRYDNLKLTLREYVELAGITGDCEEKTLRPLSPQVTLHFTYSNGETKELTLSAPCQAKDPLTNTEFALVTDDIGNIVCNINQKSIPIGKATYIEATDPSVYQLTEAGLYTIHKNELFNGRYCCLAPALRNPESEIEDIYFITINGNVDNNFSVTGLYNNYLAEISEKTDEGIFIAPKIGDMKTNILRFNQLGDNTEFTVKVQRLLKPVSATIELKHNEFTIDTIALLNADIHVIYEDGTSEIISVTEDCESFISKELPLKNGTNITLHSSGYAGLYTIRLTYGRKKTLDSKEIVIFPKDYKTDCDAELNLNDNTAQIIIPALEKNDNYLLRINSQITKRYHLKTDTWDIHFGVFEEKDNHLVPCEITEGEDVSGKKIYFEKGKTYYLLCNTSMYYQPTETLISLEDFYYDIDIVNIPSEINNLQDLKNAEILVKHTSGADLSIPLLIDDSFTTYPGITYQIQKKSEKTGSWSITWDKQEDFLEYLTTGNLVYFVPDELYRFEIYYANSMYAGFEFIPKKNDATINGTIIPSSGTLKNVKLDVLQDDSLIKTDIISNGNFSFSGLGKGKYIIRFSSEGYITKEVPVTVGEAPVTIDTKLWKITDAAALCEASLSLEGQIGVNLIVNLSESMQKDSEAYAELTQEGGSNPPLKVKLNDATVDSTTGNHIFTYPVAAKEINDKITISIYSGEGEQLPLRGKADRSVELSGNKFSYAAADYINSKKNSSSTIGSLMKALSDYGIAAEKYFQYGDMGATGITADLSSVTQSVLSPYKAVGSGDRLDGVSVSASLMLESMTSINVNYAISGNVSDYVFTCDGQNVTPVKAGNEYQVAVANIAAKDLEQMHVFTISDKSGKTQTVKYSALSYAYSKVNSTGEISTVAKTLYLYNKAAEGYFGV